MKEKSYDYTESIRFLTEKLAQGAMSGSIQGSMQAVRLGNLTPEKKPSEYAKLETRIKQLELRISRLEGK